MKIKVGLGKKKFDVNARELSEFEMFFGLMFKTKESENLLFDKKGRWAFHSFFVFFPFLALWLDEKNKVVDSKIVKPFSFFVMSRKEFAKLVEIPINVRNESIISLLRRD